VNYTRLAVALVASVAVFAGVSASAATLGGLSTSDVGANSNTVAAQLTGGVSVQFTTAYDATVGYYKVTQVQLTPISTSQSFGVNSTIRLTLKGAANASLGEFTQVFTNAISGAAAFIPITGTLAASDVQGVSVVVNGGPTTALLTTGK
jgi:hypothetical protein